MAYSPAFQLYYKDFRQDPKTICMNAVEIGSYFLLLMECWDRDNKLPNDIEELAVIARVSVKQFEKMWNSKIRRCFQFDGSRDVFWHKRLGLEIDKQKRWAAQQSDNGRKGAEKRWADKSNEEKTLDSDRMAGHSDPMAPDSFSSSFSSSSSSSSTKSKETKKEKRSPQAAPPTKRGTRIPEPFNLTREMREYAATKRPDVDVILETEKFTNHFRAAPGQKGLKLDWGLTWRNWILSARSSNGTNRSNYGPKRTDDDVFAESKDFYERYPS